MRYVALLRGINVGGKNKVDMATLRETFTRAGAVNVLTYINSGNVVFDHERAQPGLTTLLEEAIAKQFDLQIKVLLRDLDSIREVVAAIPGSWTTDGTMRTRVLFIWEDFDAPEVVDQLPTLDGIDEILYVPGAVIWKVNVENLTKSGQSRLVGTELYRAMTIRNSNTVRKLASMMEEPAEG